MTILTNNQILFSIDRSFYPEKSYLIAVYILASIRNKIVMRAKFITTAVLEYQHLYAAELCRSLRIFVILKRACPPESKGSVRISINSDCQAVINTLYNTYTTIQFSTYLYQIRREINIIAEEIGITT